MGGARPLRVVSSPCHWFPAALLCTDLQWRCNEWMLENQKADCCPTGMYARRSPSRLAIISRLRAPSSSRAGWTYMPWRYMFKQRFNDRRRRQRLSASSCAQAAAMASEEWVGMQAYLIDGAAQGRKSGEEMHLIVPRGSVTAEI